MGWHEKYGGQEAFEATFDQVGSVRLPKWSDIYGKDPSDFLILRTYAFIKTEREREIGLGEDWPHDPLPLGNCWSWEGHAGDLTAKTG